MDMEFERRNDVKGEEYLEMIRLKTSVLLATNLKIGALLGGTSAEDVERLHGFSVSMGIAFQLKDDLLNVYDDAVIFRKSIGGDILCNKKTYMLIRALDHTDEGQLSQLEHWITIANFNPVGKIAAVTGLYNQVGVRGLCENEMVEYSDKAIGSLAAVSVSDERRKKLGKLIKEPMYREM